MWDCIASISIKCLLTEEIEESKQYLQRGLHHTSVCSRCHVTYFLTLFHSFIAQRLPMLYFHIMAEYSELHWQKINKVQFMSRMHTYWSLCFIFLKRQFLNNEIQICFRNTFQSELSIEVILWMGSSGKGKRLIVKWRSHFRNYRWYHVSFWTTENQSSPRYVYVVIFFFLFITPKVY